MSAIFKKEFRSWFLSPMGYIVLFVFSFFSGVYFLFTVIGYGSSSLSTFFQSIILLTSIVVAVICMRLFSEERKAKTDQLLLTSPVSLSGIVMGKFLAAFAFFCICLAETLVFVCIIGYFGSPDWGVMLTNYVGYMLLGASLIAIGCFFSSITQSQLISVFVTILTFVALMYVSQIIQYVISVTSSLSRTAASLIMAMLYVLPLFDRFYDFSLGVINASAVVYYLSVTFIFLFLTTRVLEKRRWS